MSNLVKVVEFATMAASSSSIVSSIVGFSVLIWCVWRWRSLCCNRLHTWLLGSESSPTSTHQPSTIKSMGYPNPDRVVSDIGMVKVTSEEETMGVAEIWRWLQEEKRVCCSWRETDVKRNIIMAPWKYSDTNTPDGRPIPDGWYWDANVTFLHIHNINNNNPNTRYRVMEQKLFSVNNSAKSASAYTTTTATHSQWIQ